MNNVNILYVGCDVLATILGLQDVNIDVEIYVLLLRLVADCVYRMYKYVLKERDGIG